jgi:hypothetical protein
MFALALAVLAAPTAKADGPGHGELWLHHGVMDYYRQFQADPDALYFAVSTNGLAAGYARCEAGKACRAASSERAALASCRAAPIDLPGECFIFASRQGVVWQGEVHVLDHQAWLERLYGPATIEESLAHFARHAEGPGAAPVTFRVTDAIRRRADFAAAPAGFALSGDECRYALELLYREAAAPNFFLADESGRFCGYATGYAQAEEQQAFAAAKAACEAMTPAGGRCLVYAVERSLVAELQP